MGERTTKQIHKQTADSANRKDKIMSVSIRRKNHWRFRNPRRIWREQYDLKQQLREIPVWQQYSQASTDLVVWLVIASAIILSVYISVWIWLLNK